MNHHTIWRKDNANILDTLYLFIQLVLHGIYNILQLKKTRIIPIKDFFFVRGKYATYQDKIRF